jgi:nicotinate phosphoribosyltransferase
MLADLYRPSLALLTDLYQVTMAYGYWKAGVHRREAVFHLFFRERPFGGGYTVASGLGVAIEYLERLRFDEADLAYLASLRGADGRPLFEKAFLDFLRDMPLEIDADAVPEGTIVFPHEPLVRVRGPIIPSQLLETPLLTLLGFPTLVATKAARVVQAARGEPVLEFGLRRAQGIDGALSATRAAYIGGCAGTSNLLAGQLLGIPVRGTHAHSWVMCFDDELEAFYAYARAMPNNCVFLVDTYDTLDGVRRAVEVGRWLRCQGHDLLGIRLDSGDLAYLSIQARRILDEAGFAKTVIFASSDLDEHLIESLKQQRATIAAWGVGTKLATSYDDPALGCVYKLSAVRDPGSPWKDRLKLSEQAVKISNPGHLQVRRYVHNGEAVADAIYDEQHPLPEACVIVDPADPTRRKAVPRGATGHDLLTPIFRGGKRVYDVPPLEETRRRVQQQLALFHNGIKRLVNPHRYPAGLEQGLFDRKTEIILKLRGLRG